MYRYGIPAAFVQILKNNNFMKSSADEVCELESVLWRHGFDYKMTSAEISILIDRLVTHNWIHTLSMWVRVCVCLCVRMCVCICVTCVSAYLHP